MKAQAALEFTMIIAIVLIGFIGFLYIINDQVETIAENEDEVAIQNLATYVLNEIDVARQVHSNYLRYFDIEPNLNGKKYDIKLLESEGSTIKKNILSINITENNNNPAVAYAFLDNVNIHGDFVEVKNGTNKGYCITRDTNDNIMISKNQISFKPARKYNGSTYKDMEETDYDGIIYSVPKSKFTLYLMANCVKDFSKIDITIHHTGFKYNKAYSATTHTDVASGTYNLTYGNDMFQGDTRKAIFTSSTSINSTNISITNVGTAMPSGTDALIELEFDKIKKLNGFSVETNQTITIDINDYIDYNNADNSNPSYKPPMTKPIQVKASNMIIYPPS